MKNQTEHAYQYIKERILNGTFKPAQKLVETQLAELIGVNRNTIKKALLLLQQDHLVHIENNKGASIKSYSLEEVIDQLEIIEVLEGLVAKNAASNIEDSELDELDSIIHQMEQSIREDKIEAFVTLFHEFHSVIYRAAKNRQAVELVNAIRMPMRRFQFRTVLLPGRKHESLAEKRRVFDALKNHDPVGAEDAIRSEMAHFRDVIKQNYYLLF